MRSLDHVFDEWMKVILNNKYGWLEHLSLFKKVIKEWNESEDFSLSNLFYLAVIYSRLLHGTIFKIKWFDLIYSVQRHLQQYFSYTSFSGGRSLSTRREPPTMDKQLVNFIICGCESSAPIFVIYKARREPTPYWW